MRRNNLCVSARGHVYSFGMGINYELGQGNGAAGLIMQLRLLLNAGLYRG